MQFWFGGKAHLTKHQLWRRLRKPRNCFRSGHDTGISRNRFCWKNLRQIYLEPGFLQAVFPPSYFVVIMRHPIAVAEERSCLEI